MNSSWNNSTNNHSLGFLYFNPSRSTSNNSDFLSFDNTTSSASPSQDGHNFKDFSPQSYSSPRKPYYRRSSGFDNGPRGNKGQPWRKSWGLTRNDHDHYHHIKNGNFRKNLSIGPNNTSAYYDPTCLQDPWIELEQKLSQRQNSQIKSTPNSPISASQGVQNGDSESSSEGENSSSSGAGVRHIEENVA
ncbi:uncharacterized protein [Euwallacea fornicatus]|uniref:uncharacterized protein n=1 Tax=Euwallacea fornicatus TaxID=995702 RepID=UPI00339012C1